MQPGGIFLKIFSLRQTPHLIFKKKEFFGMVGVEEGVGWGVVCCDVTLQLYLNTVSVIFV